MKCAVVFEKLIRRGDIVTDSVTGGEIEYPDKNTYWSETTPSVLTLGNLYLAPGTYTVSADVPEGVTCKVYTWEQGTTVPAGQFPANDAEGALPFTFTVSVLSDVVIGFAYAGWERGTALDEDDVGEIRIHDAAYPNTEPVYDTAVLRPDEITDSGVLAKAKNSKSNISLTVLPAMEAYGFCERSVTYVSVYDLDLLQDRTIFEGRVTGVRSCLQNSRHFQEVTCASALDFLEDTPALPTAEGADSVLNDYMTEQILAHNRAVDWQRKLLLHSEIPDNVWNWRQDPADTVYTVISDLLTRGEKLYRVSDHRIIRDPIVLEFRESYRNGFVYLDVAESFGEVRDTPFLVGDNLREISVDKSVDGGIYTQLKAIGGVNSDGSRYKVTADNAEMVLKYGTGHVKIVKADSISCSAPVYEWVPVEGGSQKRETEEYKAMKRQLEAYAASEVAKLSDPAVKISLKAEDLSNMGYTGYEPFELGDRHPIVDPQVGFTGQLGRITEIRRRLSDGRIGSIVVEYGRQLLNSPDAAPMTQQAAKSDTERKRSEAAEKQAEITQNAIEEATDGAQTRIMDKATYDNLNSYNPHTLYVVDNNGTNELYIGEDHISSGGGGGGTIENAVILTNEQNSEWAPEHEIVDVDFRGGCSMWYGGIPARIVVQGLRVLVQVDEQDMEDDDLMTELTLEDTLGVSVTYKCIVSSLQPSRGYVKIQYYQNGQYVGETGNYSIGAGAGFTEKTFGMVLLFGGWTLYNNLLYPTLDMAFAYIIDGTPHRTTAFGLPGNLLTNPMTCSAAERGFGTTLLRKTEPSS